MKTRFETGWLVWSEMGQAITWWEFLLMLLGTIC